jgi:hypothetical protein
MMDFNTYRALPGVNASTLKALDPPLRARWQAEQSQASAKRSEDQASATAAARAAIAQATGGQR